MYKIYCDGICIHDDIAIGKENKVLNPKLTLEDNAAGSLEITIPPGNIGYDSVERITSELIVERDSLEIWSGRVITEKMDFWNQRILTCEGALSYLNDTHQEPASYSDMDVSDFLECILRNHNLKVDVTKQLLLGTVDVHKNITCTTNYETTLDCILENVINKLGGHISIRKDDDEIRYLDYFESYNNTNSQVVEFGNNLIDFTKNWDMTSYSTVIIPRGAKLENSTIEGIEEYLTVKNVNAGSIYVTDENAIDERGWIESIVDFEDITDAYELLEKAEDYISDTQFENLILELSAIDLHYLSRDIESIKLLDQIRCISVPHGLNKIFPVSKLEIPIDHPENAKYTLGTSVKTTFTSSTNKTNSKIAQKIDKLPSKETILKKAAENAAGIMNQATNGYITITKIENDNQTVTESIFITDTDDYTEATRAWRWNVNGLAYYDTDDSSMEPINYDEEFPKIALTMDGAINADLITVGSMSADRIRTGRLESSEVYEYWDSDTYYSSGEKVFHNGQYWKTAYGANKGIEPGIIYWEETLNSTGSTAFNYSTTYYYGDIVSYNNKYWKAKTTVKNIYPGEKYWIKSDKNVIFDLNMGKLTISSGEISLGEMDATGKHKFQVDDDGYLHAYYGEIGAFTITDDSIYSNNLKLLSYGIKWLNDDGDEIGKQGINNWQNNNSYKGLVSDLEIDGSYIAWAVKMNSTDDIYTVKLFYTRNSFSEVVDRKTITYQADTLNVGCDVDFHNWAIKNCVIERGASREGYVYIPFNVMTGGTGGIFQSGCIRCQLKDGILYRTP